MAPDPELPRHAACPACGAALRPGSPWCTLCYADLRPPEQRPVQPAAEPPAPPAPPARPAGDPLTQPLIDFLPSSVLHPTPSTPPPTAPVPTAVAAPQPPAERTWPCTTCGTANPLAAAHCAACGAAFLAAVAADSRAALVLPVVGDLTKMSRAQRVLGALTVVVVLVVFVAVVTLLLSKRPPDTGVPTETPTLDPGIAVVQPTTAPAVTGPPASTLSPSPSATATSTALITP